MDIKIIEDRLKNYKTLTKQQEKNALREIAQEIALCGLARTNFFKHASFILGRKKTWFFRAGMNCAPCF